MGHSSNETEWLRNYEVVNMAEKASQFILKDEMVDKVGQYGLGKELGGDCDM